MNDDSMRERLRRLLQQHRWAALATVDGDGVPTASMVGYVMGEQYNVAYLHLSRLAAHTANLLAYGHAALIVSEADRYSEDPQELTRVSLQGKCITVARDCEEYAAARERYLQRLPASQRLFEFPDFLLFRLDVASARFVGGFAQARTFSSVELRTLS